MTRYGPYPKFTLVKVFKPNISLTLNKHQVMEATRHHGMLVRRAFQRRRKEPPQLLLKGWFVQLFPTTERPSHLNIINKRYKVVYFDEAQDDNTNTEQDPHNTETPTTQTHAHNLTRLTSKRRLSTQADGIQIQEANDETTKRLTSEP